MTWLYLSPHFDDVALSCGGLIWEQTHNKERVEVCTVCSGHPIPDRFTSYAAELHQRWKLDGDLASDQRAREDDQAMRRLGAHSYRLGLQDVIYRRLHNGDPVVQNEDDLFQAINPGEIRLVKWLADQLSKLVSKDTVLVSPLGIGGHVDHRLVKAAAENLAEGLGNRLWYYADYPYVVQKDRFPRQDLSSISCQVYPVSTGGMSAWVDAVAAYTSQISSFWESLEEMRIALQEYARENQGILLYQVVP